MPHGDPASPGSEPSQDIWRALADPSRRRILDVLRDKPLTTGAIASHFSISRVAVMKHLARLDAAGLVTSRKRGRERWHYVNLAPILTLHERWTVPVAGDLARGLLDLKDQLEGSMAAEVTTIDVAVDVEIATSPHRVFDAISRTPGAWWGPAYLRPDATDLTLEPRIGATLVEEWPGGGMILATVTGLTEDCWIQFTGPFHLGAASAVAEFELTPRAGGCLVALTFRGAGLIETGMAAAFEDGWRELVGDNLKRFCETGDGPAVSADRRSTD